MKLPLIGFGTWELRGTACFNTIKLALELGYRHIDTAHLYENHEEIGKAIANFPREKLFLTSKFSPDQNVTRSCDEALTELNTSYLDLYLLHYPDFTISMEPILEELSQLKDSGKIQAFGVSNFTVDLLKAYPDIHPMANQVEFHPFLYDKELLVYCKKQNITLISYRSLGKGKLLTHPVIVQIAKKHQKTPAQILLKWCIDKEIPVIPKASSQKHLLENLDLYSFSLEPEDLEILDNFQEQKRFCIFD